MKARSVEEMIQLCKDAYQSAMSRHTINRRGEKMPYPDIIGALRAVEMEARFYGYLGGKDSGKALDLEQIKSVLAANGLKVVPIGEEDNDNAHPKARKK